MTLPQRPEGMPELTAHAEVKGEYIVCTDDDTRDLVCGTLTKEEAEYAAALVNAAPALLEELSALREARRERDEQLANERTVASTQAAYAVEQRTLVLELRALVREAVPFVGCIKGLEDYASKADNPKEATEWLEKALAVLGEHDTHGRETSADYPNASHCPCCGSACQLECSKTGCRYCSIAEKATTGQAGGGGR